MRATRRTLMMAPAMLMLGARDGLAVNPKQSGVTPVQIIDFNRARMEWMLPTGIRGSWRLIASASSTHAGSDSDVYLAAGVMAGQIFGDRQLPIDPPFSYHVIASRTRHAMIRNGATSGPGSDTIASNQPAFKSLDFHLPIVTGQRIDLASGDVANHWPLQVRVVAQDRERGDWILQFPVSHVSDQHAPNGRQFQIETGPVLVPKQLLESSGIPPIGDHHLAYVFFNQLDRMDLLILGRESEKTSGSREFRHVQRISNVAIDVYSVA